MLQHRIIEMILTVFKIKILFDDVGSYKIIFIVVFVLSFLIDKMVEVDFIPQESTKAREAFKELCALR